MRAFKVLPVCLALALASAAALPAQSDRYREISVPTRDGRSLAADLYASDTSVARPVVLIQTPYNKNFYRIGTAIPPQAGGAPFPYDSAHYDYVIVDWRGFFGSKDAAVAGYDRGLDGYDAVEWIAQQPWCNGKVGTWGPSALGLIQFQTAREHPPHLVCICPLVKDYRTNYFEYYDGGVLRREHVETLQQLGLVDLNLVLQHPTRDLVWQSVESSSDYPEEIGVPVLMIGGWYDHFPDDVLRAFDDLKDRGDPAVRNEHRLVMGPWTHGGIGKLKQGALEYPGAEGYDDSVATRFFDHYLRGVDDGYERRPRIEYFQMGTDQWRSTDDWYEFVSGRDTLRLEIGAGHVLHAGHWSTSEADTLDGDPRDPSPTIGGPRLTLQNVPDGPQDQAEVEARADALVYTSEPQSGEIEIDGSPSVLVALLSDRYDSDIAARLTDVYPDGRSMLITQGIRRLRFRSGDSPQDTASVVPQRLTQVVIGLQNVAITIPRDHRLRLIITTSNYPQYDVNPNTGGPLNQPGDTLDVTDLILTGDTAVTELLLPVKSSLLGVGVEESARGESAELRLGPVWPNPAGDAATVPVELPRAGHVRVRLVDALGRRVATAYDGMLPAGHTGLPIDLTGVAPGLYFCVVEFEGEHTIAPLTKAGP